MTDKARLKIAALMTALFLAAVSAAGIVAHTPHAPAQTSGHVVMTAPHRGHSQPSRTPPTHDHEHD